MNEKSIGTKSTSVVSNAGWTAPPREQASSAVEGVRDFADEVKQTAAGVADQARKAAESQLTTGKDRAIDGLGRVANAIRKTGEHLRAEDEGAFTPYFDRVAQQIDTTGSYLRTRTIAQVAGDVEAFARREPALFLGGAFAAGLIGSRFLKSSKPEVGPTSRSGPSAAPNPPADRGPAKSTLSSAGPTKNGTGGGPAKPFLGGGPAKSGGGGGGVAERPDAK